MKEPKEVQNLIKKYLSGRCTPEEAAAIEKWYADYLAQNGPSFEAFDREETKEAVWQEISRHKPDKVRKIAWRSRAAAAAVLIAGLFAFYQLVVTAVFTDKENLAQQEPSIMPSENNAVLTTADGRKIALVPSAPDVLEQGEGFEIKKEADGVVVFDVKAKGIASTSYNTIETPKGGVYQVVLPDGSKAWLNNASSISFPTQFAANERSVRVTGEVYFEVEHD